MMEQNFDLFPATVVTLPVWSECDRGIDKTLGSISAAPNPLGAHFPAQRLTIEPNKTLALAKTCQVGVCALGRLSF